MIATSALRAVVITIITTTIKATLMHKKQKKMKMIKGFQKISSTIAKKKMKKSKN